MLKKFSWRGPTEEELKVVKDVFKKTGILTVKDASTGYPQQRPYAEEYREVPDGTDTEKSMPGFGRLSQDVIRIRTVATRLIGSKRLPKGIAIAGSERWVRDSPIGYAMIPGASTDFSATDFIEDICTEEKNRLAAWANDQVWVTDEMVAEADRTAATRRQHQTETQQDPVGVLVRALAQAQSAGQDSPTAAELEALGLIRDPATGKWTKREAVGAK